MAWLAFKATILNTPSSGVPLNMFCFTPLYLLLTQAWSVCTGWDGRDCRKAQSNTSTLEKKKHTHFLEQRISEQRSYKV